MLTLSVIKTTHNISTSSEHKRAFNDVVVFYTGHPKDSTKALTTLNLLDIKRGTITSFVSYSPENHTKITSAPDAARMRQNAGNSTFGKSNVPFGPHSTLHDKKNGAFVIFVERSSYFYRLDYRNNKITIYTLEDLGTILNVPVADVCCTVYEDCDDSDYFYTSVTSEPEKGERSILFVKMKKDFSKYHMLSKQTFGAHVLKASPHVIKKIEGLLFCSEFYNFIITLKQSGREIHTATSFANFIYEDILARFKKLTGVSLFEKILRNNTLSQTPLFKKLFRDYYSIFGKSIYDICKNNAEYDFTISPGNIFSVDCATAEMNTYATSGSLPAHFEFDNDTHTLYVSSHNFITFDRVSFTGPAAIDKFILENGSLVRAGTFQMSNGYRYTSHKFFKHNGTGYLCTFGQPNLLVFINAETMELEYFDIIGEDLLTEQSDISSYLSSIPLDSPSTIKTLTVSSSGSYILFLAHDHLGIYSFPEKKIVATIPYKVDIPVCDGVNLKEFLRSTTHFDNFTDVDLS